MRAHRRIAVTAVAVGASLATVVAAGSVAAPAGATASGAAVWPNAPTGLHVVSASATVLTVRVKPAAHASKYRLYASTVKSDVYYQELTHPKTQSSHLVTATTAKPEMTVKVHYTTAPYYYRVATINGGHVRFSSAYPSVYLRPAAPSLGSSHDDGNGPYLRWTSRPASGFKVEQSSTPDFSSGNVTYTTHGAGRTLTPYGLSDGTTYYFRVAAVNNGRTSRWSSTVSAADTTHETPLRVATYNTLNATYDGTKDNGGTIAPFSKRLPGQVALLKQANADIIGIQEANACIVKSTKHHCTRQVDEQLSGINGGSGTWQMFPAGNDNSTYFDGNYILYKPSVVTPVGAGGYWTNLGNQEPAHDAAYQLFADRATGAQFLFVTVHIVSTKGAKYDRQRKLETEDMVQRARAYASSHGNVPILFTGDFNSWPGRYQFVDTPGNYMLSQGIPDSFEVARTRQNPQYETINQYYRKPPHGGDADHVFATPGIGVKDWHQLLHLKGGKFVGVIPSDHNPVYADLELPY